MFGRVTIQKSTQKFLEFQSGDASLGTLTQNAINAGISKDDIEEKYITEIEFKILKEKNISFFIHKEVNEIDKLKLMIQQLTERMEKLELRS